MAINIKLKDLVYPYFVVSGKARKEIIKSFPGQFRFSTDRLLKDIAEIMNLGLDKILLFGVPDSKDASGRAAYENDNIVSRAVKAVKKEFPNLVVFTDVCLCAYTTHGHCGILKGPGRSRRANGVVIDSGETLKILAKIAVSHAEAGADWVAPSAMAKGQVAAIRKALDDDGYINTKILGYSAKFASNFYGPFRNAASSSPKFGDRRSYQLDYADSRAAIRKIRDDITEGADMVMVKPALGYLDIIKEAKLEFAYPLAAYNVSGEYSFVKYGAKAGLWDEAGMVYEVITSIKRAGADLIISYHARDAAKWLKKE